MEKKRVYVVPRLCVVSVELEGLCLIGSGRMIGDSCDDTPIMGPDAPGDDGTQGFFEL